MRGTRSGIVAAGLVATLLLTIVAGCSSSKQSDAGPPSLGGLEIPLKIGRSKSDLRATIETTIGGIDQTLLFDTGSAGLTVLSTAVPPSVSTMTGAPFQGEFAGGVVLNGIVIAVPVEVGGNATVGSISIQLVQSATCASSAPSCAAKDGMSAFGRSIGADGIFGAGLWSSGSVFSPLLQLASGVPSSIAVTWRGTEGIVSLDPTLDESPVATVSMPPGSPATLPDGPNAWNNLSVPICWQIDDAQQTCAPTALDTGASAMSFPIGFPGGPATDVKEFAKGQSIGASTSLGEAPFLEFSTGRSLGSNLVTVIPGQSAVNTGLQIFGRFIVEFSLTGGAVSFVPIDDLR